VAPGHHRPPPPVVVVFQQRPWLSKRAFKWLIFLLVIIAAFGALHFSGAFGTHGWIVHLVHKIERAIRQLEHRK
jgi:hypothetical protein